MTRTSKYGPLRHGDVRDDGFIFRAYKPDGKASWHSPEGFHRVKISQACKNARIRARAKALPFDIDANYLAQIFPQDGRCPALGIPMHWGDETGLKDSPSLDRIEPEIGYVRGNVQWVSNLANMIKTSASTEQVCAVGAFMKAQDGYRAAKAPTTKTLL